MADKEAMDIYDYLKSDHRKASQLMKEVLAAQNSKERQEAFHQVTQELILHADSEHETFYKALREAGRGGDIQQLLDEADQEHEQVVELLNELSDASIENEQLWVEKFKQLQEAVLHHVNKEEGEIFNMAQKILSDEQATELASDMEDEKERIVEALPKSERLKGNEEGHPAARA